MNSHEIKLYKSLLSKGWFKNEEEPLALVPYSLTDRCEERQERASRRKKSKKTVRVKYEGLHEVKGIALFYPDRALLFENGEKAGEKPIEDLAGLRVLPRCGSVILVSGDNVICRGVMRAKKSFSSLARRLKYISLGKEPRREDSEASYCKKCGMPLNTSGDYCFRCAPKKGVIKRLLAYTKGARIYMIASVIAFFAVTGVNLLSPYVSSVLVDKYIEPKNDNLIGFLCVVLAMLAVSLSVRILSIIRSRVLIRASEKLIVTLRDDVFAKIQKLSVSNVSRRTAGNLMHRVTRDTQVIQVCLSNHLPALIEQALLLISISVILLVYDYRLALLIFAPVPIVLIFQRVFWKRVRTLYDMQWVAETKVETFLHDIFSGIRVVKAFGTEKRDNEKFHKLTDEECRIAMRNEKFFAVFSPLVTYAITLGEIVLLYYVGTRHLAGQMSLGDIAMFTSYVSLVYGPLGWFGGQIRNLTRGLRSAAKVFEIIDEKEDVPDSDESIAPEISGKIEFRDVSFGYDESREVLHGINLKIEPGEMIGIVGRSGVGKSTLINLVMRMYDPDDGQVLFDGVDAKDIPQEYLRSKIGAVLQETFLFSGSIYDNIAYADPGATREKVLAASKLAGAHDFIIKLPDAYNTKVGERGYTLSGGERQRVTIARALLHDPKILILDEATSALDTETEKQIQDALAKLIKDRTTIAIAHRLSTLRNATRLIVIDKGTIAEMGTHEELMRLGGIYYGLVMAQRQMSTIKGKGARKGATPPPSAPAPY